jgi:hypothetical protein
LKKVEQKTVALWAGWPALHARRIHPPQKNQISDGGFQATKGVVRNALGGLRSGRVRPSGEAVVAHCARFLGHFFVAHKEVANE